MPFDFAPLSTVTYTHNQWLRKWSLTLGGDVSGSSGAAAGLGALQGSQEITTEAQGYDLRMRFQIRQANAQTPNTAIIRVYNLAASTVQSVIAEYDSVILQAGYVTGNYGVIFMGTIKQFKRGRESATDTYLDIFAADGDLAHNTAQMNATLAAGWKLEGQRSALAASQQQAQNSLTQNPPPTLGTTSFPRERVFFGHTADEIRTFVRNTNTIWSIQNGAITNMPADGYLTGNLVKINAQTGMIGMPEDTQQGIMVTSLLNPAIKVGGQVQLDNASINTMVAPGGGSIQGQAATALSYNLDDSNFYASIANDGIYMVMVIDYDGDTRGLPWYSKMTCRAMDTANAQNVVLGSNAGDL
jgi:hypothetical protein